MRRILDYRRILKRNHPINCGLVSEWKVIPGLFGGKTFYDVCGRNNGTLVNNPTWSSSNSYTGNNGYLNLTSASSQYVDLGVNNTSLSPTGPFTVSCWFKTTSSAQMEIFASYRQNSQVAGIIVGINITGQGAGKFGVLSGGNLGTSIGSDYQFVSTQGTHNNGTWQHGVAIWDGASLLVYTNGVFNNSVVYGFAPVYATAIGSYSRIGDIFQTNSEAAFFDGSLDQIVLWNRAFSANEVFNLYNESRLGNPNRYNWIPIERFGIGSSFIPYYRYNMFNSPVLRGVYTLDEEE